MTSAPPRVSVLITAYNALPHLVSCVESVLGQSFRDFEVVIVDDCSTDGTSAYLAEIAPRQPHVHVHRNPRNRGRSASAEIGVRLCSGEFVARLDADDEMEPTRLEKQLAHMVDHPDTDVLGSWATEIDRDGQVIGSRQLPTSHRDIVRLLWLNPIINSSAFFRKSSLLRAGSYDGSLRFLEDYELWFRCVSVGLTLRNVPEPLVRYRIGEHQLRKRRTWAWMAARVTIGIGGCRVTKARPLTYVAVVVSSLIWLLPKGVVLRLTRILREVDPRRTSRSAEASGNAS